jgi:hypothetical protein
MDAAEALQGRRRERRRSVSMDNVLTYAKEHAATEAGAISRASGKADVHKGSKKADGVPGISHAQARRIRQATVGSMKLSAELTPHESMHIEKRQRELVERQRRGGLESWSEAAGTPEEGETPQAWQAVEQHGGREDGRSLRMVPGCAEEAADGGTLARLSMIKKHEEEWRVKKRREYLDEILDRYRLRGGIVPRLERQRSKDLPVLKVSHLEAHGANPAAPGGGKGGSTRGQFARRRDFWVELRARVKKVSAETMEREIKLAQDEHLPAAIEALMRFECSHTALPDALHQVKDLLARVEGAMETAFPRVCPRRQGSLTYGHGGKKSQPSSERAAQKGHTSSFERTAQKGCVCVCVERERQTD